MDFDSDDRELIHWLNADPAAFEMFYRRHVDRVVQFTARRVRNPADVADIVANTFVAVLTSAQSYDPERGEPVAWVIGIAARLIANNARRSAREVALASRIAGRRLLSTDDIERLEDQIEADRAAVAVIEAVDQLKPRAKEALLLVGVDGLTPTEASRVLGISAANFRMRLSAARRALAKSLHAAGSDSHFDSPQRPPSTHPILREVTL